jgi:hypothetical protein
MSKLIYIWRYYDEDGEMVRSCPCKKESTFTQAETIRDSKVRMIAKFKGEKMVGKPKYYTMHDEIGVCVKMAEKQLALITMYCNKNLSKI